MPPSVKGRKLWQHKNYCGVVTLYLFLRLHGAAVSHDAVFCGIPVTEKGVSIETLREFSARHGVHAEVVQAVPRSLSSLCLPAIAYEEVEKGKGHFTLICSWDDSEESFYGVDGRDGTLARINKAYFLSQWSGYLLVRRAPGYETIGLWTVRALFCVSFLMSVVFMCRCLRWRVIAGGAAAAFLIGAVALGGWLRTYACRTKEPALREVPLQPHLTREPLREFSRQELTACLDRTKPYWEYRRVSDISHCLRLWGPEAVFPREASFPAPESIAPLQGRQMLRLLLDNRAFEAAVGKGEALLYDGCHGIGVRALDSSRTLRHRDNLLALAAELGLPLSTPVCTSTTAGTLRDVLAESLARFTITQELEWTAVALAGYLPPERTWHNRFGETWTFDHVAAQLMTRRHEDSACYGTHIPYALATILQADDVTPIVAAGTRRKMLEYLRNLSRTLEEHQLADGSFDVLDPSRFARFENDNMRRLRVTGHHLEWVAIAPSHICPSRPAIVRAARWARAAVLQQPAVELSIAVKYPLNSHVGRALVLLEHSNILQYARHAPYHP